MGTTGRWPQVVNLWEEDGFDGLAAGLRHETSSASFQDPKLEKWWQEAAEYRSGGFERVLVPALWSRTISELCVAGVRGEVYAHEMVRVPRGTAVSFLSILAEEAVPRYAAHGWELVGAFRTALADDAECVLVRAIPSWEAWAELEKAVDTPGSPAETCSPSSPVPRRRGRGSPCRRRRPPTWRSWWRTPAGAARAS